MKTLKTADGFNTLYSEQYNQTFHSKHGVLQEAKHVFLRGTGVATRLGNNVPTSVLEIGFGTGFNFFLTASEAIARDTKLEFTSLEKELLSFETFSLLNHNTLPHINTLHTRFLEWRINLPKNIPVGSYKFKIEGERQLNKGMPKQVSRKITSADGSVYQLTDPTSSLILHNAKDAPFKKQEKADQGILNLIIGNAEETILPENTFDAVYLDAFSPDENPELWTVSFFEKLFSAMKSGALLSTYSAKGSVKRALGTVGFKVKKITGPIGKREMLTAEKL